MSREEKTLDREIVENMEESISISPETEERLQEAYREVRMRCREHRGEAMRGHAPISGMQKNGGRRKRRGFMGALIAAAVLSMSSLCVFAAMHYFDKQVSEEEGKITYSFELNYELKPVIVTAEPGYLPEGMTPDGGGKYYPEDNYGHGISIIPINTLNLEEMRGQMSFENVEIVEKTVIQDMEAHIIRFKEADKYLSPKELFLFNPQEGYVLWLYGDYNIPVEELRKVAEHLEITVEEGNESLADAAKAANGIDETVDSGEMDIYVEGLGTEQITAFGQELDCAPYGCGFTVQKAEVYDSIREVPGYTEAGVRSPEALRPWLNEDGTHKPYLRTHYGAEGNIIGEEQAVPKFLAVTVEARQYGEPDVEGTYLDANLVRMEKRQDGRLGWYQDHYYPVGNQEYELQLDMRCFYMDQPERQQNDHAFFAKNLEKGEKIIYTIVFAVDQDILEDEDTVLLLNFNSTGNDPENPRYSALTAK